jgi:NADH:ubiquinone oxidoreductase subunit 3 (subunit A)
MQILNKFLLMLSLELQYFTIIIFILTTFFVTFCLLYVTFNLSSPEYYTEKTSVYECGFEPFHSARRQFSINFYNIALLFLLFDIEILLFLPGLSCFGYLPFIGQYWFFGFFLILLLGFFYEFKSGALRVVKN